MSLWDRLFDRQSDTEQLLRRQNQLLSAQLDGAGETPADNLALPSVFWAYLAAPRGGEVVGLPAGSATVDFDDGRIQHDHYVDDVVEFRSFEDIDSDLETLRSAAIYVDVPAAAEIDDDDRIRLQPGTTTVSATKFSQIDFALEHPTRLAVVGSTRRDPLVDAVGGDLRRVSRFGPATPDAYSDGRLAWTTPDTAAREGDYAAFAEQVVPVAGQSVTILVTNTSAASNDLHAEVRGRADPDEPMRQLATTKGDTAVSQGNHYRFDVSAGVVDLDVRVENATDGNQVAAAAQMYGGGA